MSKWKMVKLGEVCKKITDGSHNPPNGVGQSQYLMLSSKNVENGRITLVEPRYLSEEDFKFENKRTEIEADDILLTIVGTIGRVALVPKELKHITLQRSVAVLKPERKHLISKYLMYVLQSMEKSVNQKARGVAQKGIYLSQVNKLEIPLPPLEEQKRIADILDKASNLIDLRKQQLEKMNLLIKSKFIDMFGDPVTNPKGWQVQRIEELCEAIFGGGTPSKSHAEYYDGDIPWVTSKDMKSILISDSIDHINDKAVLNSSAKYIPKQSLLMVIRSGILKHTLPLGINTRVVTINQDMKAFIPNANINVWFMFYTFKMHEKSLLNNVRAVTADNIEFSIIRNLMVPVPSLELQNQFAEFVEQVEKQKVVMQQSLEKMEMNYKALMQKYFG